MDLILYSKGAKLKTNKPLMIVTAGGPLVAADPETEAIGFVMIQKGSEFFSQGIDPTHALVTIELDGTQYAVALTNFDPVSASRIFPADIAAIHYNFCKRLGKHAITVIMKNGNKGTSLMMPNDTFDAYVGYCIALEKARDGVGTYARKQALEKMTDKAWKRGKAGSMLFVPKKVRAVVKAAELPKTPKELEALVQKRIANARAKWGNSKPKPVAQTAEPALGMMSAVGESAREKLAAQPA